MLVVATRNARSGGIRVEGRPAFTGELRWVRPGSLGFDPADADQIESGVVVILGHRFGDGNVEVARVACSPGPGCSRGSGRSPGARHPSPTRRRRRPARAGPGS